ncbi:type I secretion system permease/ATPase [Ruegeria arenilitoris]|uniref:type I secretion system permease/ATPase n=1 Tax=Ruegeria arenilitoris TaxID=1173585 RepID=UPI00147F075F|nr:type I secretion system permease/ATPase [Ruegeria arenilitoris]
MGKPKFVLETGRQELREVRRESWRLYVFVGVLSCFTNLLMLTGPLYMLQVYDRVLGSRSVETLVALSVLVAFLYGILGLLEYARGRIFGRVAARFQARLDRRVFEAVQRKASIAPDDQTETGLRDLEAVQRLLSSPVPMAFFDVFWTPVFLLGIWIFHPWLGAVAALGGLVILALTGLNRVFSARPMSNASRAVASSEAMSNQLRNEAEIVEAMGMRDATYTRWKTLRDRALKEQIRSADVSGSFANVTKTFRLFLQSAILGVGAFLVLQGELTAGAMIASSILLGRALAPMEQLVAQWQLVQTAKRGWDNLAELLGTVPPERVNTRLPKPKAKLVVQNLTVFPPNSRQAALKSVSFNVNPGEAVGLIGSSGAGKSTLARSLTGVWRPHSGTIRLDGAALDQYGSTELGSLIGYLPQRFQLFDGTIAENIARMAPEPDDAAVVAAAKKADAHEMILRLADGYDTNVSANGGQLSGGQMQRIGLARAMYGGPVLLVLDEPNSNLDVEGSAAVNRAIEEFKANGKSVLIVAHRPAAIQECDKLIMLDNGTVRDFGAKKDVLRKLVINHEQIAKTARQGGLK